MKKSNLILIALSVLLVGCSNTSQKSYDSAINGGISAVKEEYYGKAEAYF